MPKIKDLVIFKGKNQHSFTIWFSEKESFYVKGGIPKEIMERAKALLRSDLKLAHWNTLDEAKAALSEILDAYYKSGETTRRVIRIKAKFSQGAAFTEKPINGGWKNEYVQRIDGYNHPAIDIWHNDEGLMMDIEWNICDVIKGAKTRIIELKRNADGELEPAGNGSDNYQGSFERNHIIMDYTPQREEFFIRFSKAFQMMADSVATFLASDIKELESKVDSNSFVLGLAKEE